MTDAEQGEELLRRYAVDWDKYTAQAGRIEALERERDALRDLLERAAEHLDDKDTECGVDGDDLSQPLGCGIPREVKALLYAIDNRCDRVDVQVCGYCDQPYLKPDLAQVLYHEQRPHRPMEALQWSGESHRLAVRTDAPPSSGGEA